jgi:pimeloyl-ACP methyl ester carboxylesterase
VDFERFEIAANGFTFSSIAAGEKTARPVVLLHGFPQSSWQWHHQLEALAEAGYRALAFDQRGYCKGARPQEIGAYRIGELINDVLAVVDAQGWDAVDVVGHDWGAAVAWALAALHPRRVKTLTAVSVPHPGAYATALRGDDDDGYGADNGYGYGYVEGDSAGRGDGAGHGDVPGDKESGDIGESDQARRSSYIEVFRREGGVAEKRLLGENGSGEGLRSMFDATGFPSESEDVEVFVRPMLEPGALTAALNWYRAMTAEDYVGIGPVTVSTLYVWSTQDAALGRKGAEATVDWVAGPYRFEVLEGVSHWVPEAAPHELNELLLEHLGAHA